MSKPPTSRWKPGVSGNPAGRPKGAKNRATLLAIAAMEGELDGIVRAILDAAKGGDMTAARLVVDKLIPTARERPLAIDLPATASSVGVDLAQQAVLEAVARGELLPGEGQSLAGILDARRRAIETVELERRIQALEDQSK